MAVFKVKYGNKIFNKNEWAEFPQERFRMTEDLINSGTLIGKSKEEVRHLLTIANKPIICIETL